MKSANTKGSGRGGARPGAGRPPGSMSKLAQAAVEAAKATGELPHEFLLRMARGQPIFREVIDPETGEITQVQEQYGIEERRDAAKAAAPYFAPKISTVEVITGVQDSELDSIIAKLAAETGIGLGTGGESQKAEAGSSTRRRAVLNPD